MPENIPQIKKPLIQLSKVQTGLIGEMKIGTKSLSFLCQLIRLCRFSSFLKKKNHKKTKRIYKSVLNYFLSNRLASTARASPKSSVALAFLIHSSPHRCIKMSLHLLFGSTLSRFVHTANFQFDLFFFSYYWFLFDEIFLVLSSHFTLTSLSFFFGFFLIERKSKDFVPYNTFNNRYIAGNQC